MYNPFENLNQSIQQLELEIKAIKQALSRHRTDKLLTSTKLETEYRQQRSTLGTILPVQTPTYSELESQLKSVLTILSDTTNTLQAKEKELKSHKVKKEKLEIVFVGLGVVALGGVATAAFFAPQIVAGATVAFLAAKPYLIALGAMVWAGLVKLGTTIAAHKTAASVIATTTATATVLTPTLYFKKSRECVGKALVGALETYGKAWSPAPGMYYR